MVVAMALVLAPAVSVAGLYHSQQMEVGAALELQKNGHFRYQLDYGAVSEHAEGDWTFDGKIVRLSTRPAPKQPSLELVRDDPAPIGQISMALEPPGFGEGYRLDGSPQTRRARRAASPPTTRAWSRPEATGFPRSTR